MGILKWIIIFTLLSCQPLMAQQGEATLSIEGIVLDSINGSALPFCSVIITATDGGQTSFTQTDNQGRFILENLSAFRYRLEVNYLGYYGKTINFTADEVASLLEVTLRPKSELLSEITVRDTLPPMVTRGDTTIYNATAFYREDQRTLRDLIDRLPGLSVDEENNITYQGKPVDNLLVEGKLFFGGDSELALNNFPADAAGRVELIKNYDKSGFGEGLQENKQMALNVLLKEEKRNVLFGNATLGAGPGTYAGGVNAFNYSRTSNIYTVLGANNINEELLSFKQRFRLLTPLAGTIPGELFSRLGEFRIFATPDNVLKADAALITVGTERSLGQRTTLNLYGVLSSSFYIRRQQEITTTVSEISIPFREVINSTTNTRTTPGFIRADLVTKMANDQKLVLSGAMNVSAGSEALRSTYQFNTQPLLQNNDLDTLQTKAISLRAEYSKRLSEGRLNLFSLATEIDNQKGGKYLESSEAFLTPPVNWPPSADRFGLYQARKYISNSVTARNYYFHRLTSSWGFSADAQVSHANWKQTIVTPVLERSAIADLRDARQRLALTSSWKGRSNEAKISLAAERQGLRYSSGNTQSRIFLLPHVEGEKIITGIGRLNVIYRREISPLRRDWFVSGPLFESFNNIRVGNESLFPFLQSILSVSFGRSNLLSGSTWLLSANYTNVPSATVIDSIVLNENVRSIYPISIERGASNTSISFSLRKDYQKSTLTINVRGLHGEHWTQNSLSSQLIPITQQTYYTRIVYRRDLGKRSRLSFLNSFNATGIEAKREESWLLSTSSEIKATYGFGEFRINTGFKSWWYYNMNDTFIQSRANAEVEYAHSKSPWTIRFQASTPIGRNETLRQSSNGFFVNSSIQSIFPAYANLGLSRQF